MDQGSNQNQEIEVKLIANGPPAPSHGQNGPVFEPGPGWGAKTKSWIGKYFWKVIFPIAIIVLVGYGISTRNADKDKQLDQQKAAPSVIQETISQTIKPGDSRTVLARRALAEYLKTALDESLSSGQKVFVETKLARTVTAAVLKTGNSVDFRLEDIKNFVAQAKGLTQSQLQKWENYARSVKF